jgi:hypothetical protein
MRPDSIDRDARSSTQGLRAQDTVGGTPEAAVENAQDAQVSQEANSEKASDSSGAPSEAARKKAQNTTQVQRVHGLTKELWEWNGLAGHNQMPSGTVLARLGTLGNSCPHTTLPSTPMKAGPCQAALLVLNGQHKAHSWETHFSLPWITSPGMSPPTEP